MTVISFVKLFVPPVVYQIKQWCKGLCVKSTKSPLPQVVNHSEKMIIIGNGPSLRTSVDLYKDEIIANDRIAVNYFASSDLYEIIKPNIYVFADPAFFNVTEKERESIKSLFENLSIKTTWPMHIIVPMSARNAPLLLELHTNKNIVVDSYFDGFQNVGEISKFEAWDKNLIEPPAQNVLNVAIYLSLYWGYKETYLIGADSSFFEDLRVDQETNELYTIDTHFYKNSELQNERSFYDSKNRGRSRKEWKLHDLIYAHGRMFEFYSDLKDYADYKGLKIYNASEYSWINVFERKKLK